MQVRAVGICGERGAIKVKAEAKASVIKSGIENVEAIKTASDIDPGDVESLSREFKAALAKGDIESLRAHTDMLASSQDFGINELRSLIKNNEGKMRENAELIGTIRHHINSNQTINQAAEDIGVWSRDSSENWRSLEDIGKTYKTWKNMNVNVFSGMKASTQRLALQSVRDDGSWAITEKMAYEIIHSPSAWSNIKDEIKPLIESRAETYLPVRGR